MSLSASDSHTNIGARGVSVIIGFVGALDTLCPQAWTSDPKSMGLHCQRTALILACMLIPQCLLFWHSEPILMAMRQDPAVAVLTAKFLRIAAIGLPAFAGFEVVRRWLQSQGIMHAPTIVVLIAAPVNVLLNYLLVWLPPPWGLGFVGAAWAMVIVFYLMLFCGLGYCYFFAPRDAWNGWERRALDVSRWGENFKLGCASMSWSVAVLDDCLTFTSAMIVGEWWAVSCGYSLGAV
jgi:MATE family multidrug resistance protein